MGNRITLAVPSLTKIDHWWKTAPDQKLSLEKDPRPSIFGSVPFPADAPLQLP